MRLRLHHFGSVLLAAAWQTLTAAAQASAFAPALPTARGEGLLALGFGLAVTKRGRSDALSQGSAGIRFARPLERLIAGQLVRSAQCAGAARRPPLPTAPVPDRGSMRGRRRGPSGVLDSWPLRCSGKHPGQPVSRCPSSRRPRRSGSERRRATVFLARPRQPVVERLDT
jgi:hypothetical protein